MSEYSEHLALANYLKYQYPKVIFFSDQSGTYKPTQFSRRVTALNSGKSIPDIFIAEPRGEYSGLFIELKKTGTRLKNSKGHYATPHLQEQAKMLFNLEKLGYYSKFAVGFDEAKKIVDLYFKL